MIYQTSHLMDYLPKRYQANTEQEQNRQAVYSFKDGYCPLRIKDKLCDKINEVAVGDKSNWIVLFIPASTSYKTKLRYESLAKQLQERTNVTATISAIQNNVDCEAKHLSGNQKDPQQVYNFNSSIFRGKKVILIDDVTTTGHSFQCCANILSALGASSVYGLFVAKTINPHWNRGCGSYHGVLYDGEPADLYDETDLEPAELYDDCDPDYDCEEYEPYY